MPVFKDLNSFMVHVQKMALEAMQDEGKEEVIKTNIKRNEQDIYSYEPQGYERRNTLTDENNFVSEMVDKDTMVVYNNAEPNTPIGSGSVSGWQVSLMVEEGRVSDMFGEGFWTKPRPATANTVEELKSSKAHIKAIQEGLRKRGINATIT